LGVKIVIEMKNRTLLISIIILLASCSSYEKLGDYKYKVTIDRVFIDDFNGLIMYIKSYRNPISDTIIFGNTIKTQRIHFERNQDTVYARATLKYNPKNKNIICVETFENGYQHYLKMDSLVRRFIQNKDGSVNLIEYKRYQDGIFIEK
jgi:hypothetical protein